MDSETTVAADSNSRTSSIGYEQVLSDTKGWRMEMVDGKVRDEEGTGARPLLAPALLPPREEEDSEDGCADTSKYVRGTAPLWRERDCWVMTPGTGRTDAPPRHGTTATARGGHRLEARGRGERPPPRRRGD